MTIDSVQLWHKRARPEPTEESFRVQVGCHLEEVCEMLDCLDLHYNWQGLVDELNTLADRLKDGRSQVSIKDKVGLLDSLADQIVTAVGVGVCAALPVAQALDEVNNSNWSKFDENGLPLFDNNGKIKKGPRYTRPNIAKLLGV